MRSGLLLLLLWLVASLPAGAQIVGASRLLRNAGGRHQGYTGIGRFQAGLTCTAFLLESPAGDRAPAHAITNGHCINSSSANEVILGRAETSRSVVFHYFVDTADRRLPIRTRRIAYSTMKGLDLAILELDSTVGDLRSRGVRPLRLATVSPPDFERVVAVGAPVTDIPQGEQFLRASECTLGPRADLIEFIWHFDGSYRNRCSDIKPGSSGTPLISLSTGEVVAVVNTTTAGVFFTAGAFACWAGLPCEITPGGFRVEPDTNYAVPVPGLDRCFDAEGRFSVDSAGCPLDNGRQLRVTQPARAAHPPARWNATLSGDAYAYYRYKVVEESKGDCRDPEGYGPVRTVAEANRIDDPLPGGEGRYHLCVLGGHTPLPDAHWQPARFATRVHLRVDSSPPTLRVPYVFVDQGESFFFDPIFVVPELVDYRYKIGSAATRCDDLSGYHAYMRVPLRIPKTPDAARLCLIGFDEADNPAAPLEFALDGLRVFPNGVVHAASREPGPLAPRQRIAVRGVGLADARAELVDSAARTWPVRLLSASSIELSLAVPDGIPPGPAALRLSGSRGRAEAAVAVEPVAPGLSPHSNSPVGAAVIGVARADSGGAIARESGVVCGPASFCSLTAIRPPSEGERVWISVIGAGFLGAGEPAELKLDVAGIEMELVSAGALPGPPGLEEITFRLPNLFPLGGYVPLTLTVNGRRSNSMFLWLGATPDW